MVFQQSGHLGFQDRNAISEILSNSGFVWVCIGADRLVRIRLDFLETGLRLAKRKISSFFLRYMCDSGTLRAGGYCMALGRLGSALVLSGLGALALHLDRDQAGSDSVVGTPRSEAS